MQLRWLLIASLVTSLGCSGSDFEVAPSDESGVTTPETSLGETSLGDETAKTDTTPPTPDAEVDTATTDSIVTPDGPAPDPCLGKIIYVSVEGKDSNEGCLASAPKRSIGAALSYLATVGLTGFEVRVCRGLYKERKLTVSWPASLSGGYDCASWKRTAGYGYPMFDRVNETIIENETPLDRLTTLLVTGASIDAKVTLDGFTVHGATSTTAAAAGLQVNASAAPTLSNLVVDSANGFSASYFGSVAVYVHDNAAPILEKSALHGGAGNGKTVGSVGVLLDADAGAARVHGNRIDGGTGKSGGDFGSAGVYVVSTKVGYTGAAAIKDNDIVAGKGEGTAGDGGCRPTIGVYAAGVSGLALRNNRIRGGGGTCKGTATPYSIGHRNVQTLDVKNVDLDGNRLYGGESVAGYHNVFWGAKVQRSTSATFTNNLVHTGNESGASSGTLNELFGAFEVTEVSDALFAHNTIVFGVTKNAASKPMGLLVQGAGTHARIEHNFFLGNDAASQDAILVNTCNGKQMIETVIGNVFAGIPKGFISVTAGSTPCSLAEGFADIDGALDALSKNSGVTSFSKNLALYATCTGGSCIKAPACVSRATCGKTLFGFEPDALTALFGGGFRLSAEVPCTVSKASTSTPSVTYDFLGAPRTTPTSIGAHERDDACK